MINSKTVNRSNFRMMKSNESNRITKEYILHENDPSFNPFYTLLEVSLFSDIYLFRPFKLLTSLLDENPQLQKRLMYLYLSILFISKETEGK